MRKKVLYIQPIHASGMDMLREKYDVVVAGTEDKEVLMKEVKDASAIVSRLTIVDKDIIEAGPMLEAVAKNGVGVDNIDVVTCTEKKIAVLTTGPANSWSVAEHAMFAIGAFYKRIPYFDREMKNNNWKCRDEGGFTDVEGQVLGIAGLGRIGGHLAEMASAFRMKILVFDPFLTKEMIEQKGYQCAASFDELCSMSDVISMHVPLTDENFHMINDLTLGRMKKNALLVNFARGAIVDEDALYRALSEKRIAGACLDAFTPEPPNFDHPLYKLDNVILSPHTGGISEAARRRMSIQVAKGIDDVLSGQVPECCANKAELYKN